MEMNIKNYEYLYQFLKKKNWSKLFKQYLFPSTKICSKLLQIAQNKLI